MRLLLDTSILIALSRNEISRLGAPIRAAILSPGNESFASVACLWEIAIKTRLRKLDPLRPLHELPEYCEATGLKLLAIGPAHVLTEPDPEPSTRDPFDRLLIAQCVVENLRLVTLDRVLGVHPLAWRPV
jgi:PIN domain nuclease of toxin-antitoxin system